MRLGYGLVGGGPNSFIGNVHREALNYDPRVKLTAACFSRDSAQNAERGKLFELDEGRVYESYTKMFESEAQRNDGIAFVSITSPNSTHYTAAKAALTNGLHVLCEKPLCFEVAQAEELATIAKEKNLVFAVAHAYTGYVMVRVMREMIAKGELGDILAVNAEYAQGYLLDKLSENGANAELADWRSDPAVTGISNCVGDIGSHVENMVSFLTGLKIKRLLATVNRYGLPLEENANIIVEYDNGTNGAYWCSQIAAGRDNGLTVRIYGSLGSLEWDQHYPDYVKYTPKNEATRVLSRGTSYMSQEAHKLSRIPFGHPEGLHIGFANTYKRFIDAILKQKSGAALTPEDYDFPTVEDGLCGVKFIHAAIESADNNSKWVEL